MIKPFKITRLLATLALLMNVSIHLTPAIAAATGQMQITICSAFDTRTIAIDKNGNEIPQPSEKSKKACQICIAANTNATLPETIQITNAHHILPQQTINNLQDIYTNLYPVQNNQTRAPPQLFKA